MGFPFFLLETPWSSQKVYLLEIQKALPLLAWNGNTYASISIQLVAQIVTSLSSSGSIHLIETSLVKFIDRKPVQAQIDHCQLNDSITTKQTG